MSYDKNLSFFTDNLEKITPQTLLHLITSLNLSKINPDNLLIKSCLHILKNIDVVDETYMLPFSLAIRYGANPNILINDSYNSSENISGNLPTEKSIHIIKYIDSYNLKYINHPMINSMYIILMISGTDYKDTSDESLTSSVFTKYNKDIKSIYKILNKKYLNKLLIMLDNIKYIDLVSISDDFKYTRNMFLNDISISEVIRDHSHIFNNLLIEEMSYNSDTYYNLCIKYLNFNAFEIYLKYGNIPSYYIVNNILANYNYYLTLDKSIQNSIIINQLKEMIKCTLYNGYRLDPYQSKYLNENVETFMMGNGKVGDLFLNHELKIFADILFIDSKNGRRYIMNELREITDIKRLKLAAMKMSILRTGELISNGYRKTEMNYLNQRFKNITDNKNELDIIYYTDNNQITWVFTSEMFEKLMNTKTNIYTDESIDLTLLKKISGRRNLLKRLGFMTNYVLPEKYSPSPCISYDLVDYETPQKIRNKFFYLSKLYDITPSQLEGLQIDNIQHIIESINKKIYNTENIINVKILHKDHAHLTFYKYICDVLRDNIDIIPSFFATIKQIV